MLHKPFYAGAYTWGRHPVEAVRRDGQLRKRRTPPVSPVLARVFLPDHHEGYLYWPTLEEHQRMIQRNYFRGESDDTRRVRPGRVRDC